MTKVIGMIAVKNEMGNYLIQVGTGEPIKDSQDYYRITQSKDCINIPTSDDMIKHIFTAFASEIVSKTKVQ